MEKYKAPIIDGLAAALRLYTMQQRGDPEFFSDNLKSRDELHEFRYMLMAAIYFSAPEAARAFWQGLEKRVEPRSEPSFDGLRQEVLANVALAKAFDKAGVKYWWAQKESNDIDRLTFWFMNESFAYAIASDGSLKVVQVVPRAKSQERHPQDFQSISDRLGKTGYYFMLPDSAYDSVTGEPGDQLISKVAELKLPAVDQWQDEVKKLQST
jgi:hypothetical protein